MPNIADECIKKRTVFFTNIDGKVAFPGWAIVQTELGAMFEPFEVGQAPVVGAPIADYDISDPINRIDELVGLGPDSLEVVQWDDGIPIHGGMQMPRTHAKAGAFA